MSRAPFVAFVAFVARLSCLSCLIALAAGCSGTSATPTTEVVTAVTVRAETLTSGRGCGRAITEVFKYAVVVLDASGATVVGNVYDCFADGRFVELTPTGGQSTFVFEIYAFNERDYLAANQDDRIRRLAVGRDRVGLQATPPTLTTKCGAKQTEGVETLALCEPFKPGIAGIVVDPNTPAASVELSLASFPIEGGVVTCDAEYTSVATRLSVNGVVNAASQTQTPCRRTVNGALQPVTIRIAPAEVPASYSFEVALVRADGTVLGRTTCGAETKPGEATEATCKPVQ